MGSRKPPPNLYDPALFAAVERAFDATWTELQARDPFRDFDRVKGAETVAREAVAAGAPASAPRQLRGERLPRKG